MGTFLLFAMILLMASVLQTSTGFGFSILATPFLLLIFEPIEAIQINLILSLVISSVLMSKIKKDIDVGMLKKFVIGSIVGLPIGLAFLLFIEIPKLKMGISVVILLLTLLLIFQFKMNQTKTRDLVVGGLSGILTTSMGMPGPPLLLYFSGTVTEKEKVRGTTLAFYLFIYLISLVLQIMFAGTSQKIWISSAVGLPLVLIGLVCGQWLFKRINQNGFQKLTYLLLLFTGLYLLIETIWAG